ncbi:OmpA family protein [Thermospira aquatica]|uniref:OmpA family protein n=1 Tax=Thermospira aquatica TaxID=2828656 RepID=A0AAX3BCF6_9SPIR|nr:OmpA family protein [Thermospira aquatica]URA09974.1 OmpA family protein [Thermospira aquatica]
MRKIFGMIVSMVLSVLVFAQVNINTDALKQQVQTAAGSAEEQAYKKVREEFKKRIADIPFAYNSAELPLKDPKYQVMGYDVDSFMKQVLIPALSQAINALPTGRKVVIEGHANAVGPEEPQDGKRGNKALSQARAEAVLEYILRNSKLERSKFVIRAAGSSKPLSGVDPTSVKNCRVSLDIE